MLFLDNIQLIINTKYIFNNISVTFFPSSIVYLCGPNGSGKTSLLRIIAGIQNPSNGDIYFGKKKINISNMQIPFCAYIGHNTGIKDDLTVLENIKFWSIFYNSVELIDAAIYYFGLQNIAFKKCYTLSAGTKKRVALARLMSCKSDIWLLDEAYNNLDEEYISLLNNLIISKANNGGIIFFAEHKNFLIKSAQILHLHDYLQHEHIS